MRQGSLSLKNCFGLSKQTRPPLLLTSILIIIVAIVLFLDVIRIKTFRRIKYESVVLNSELEKEAVEVQSRLIATYEEALKDNFPVGGEMVGAFKRGTMLVMSSILLVFAVVLILLIVYSYKLTGDKL